MLETITAINSAVNSFVWGIPAMVCIIGVGLLLTIRTNFLQVRKFPYAIKTTIGRVFRKKEANPLRKNPAHHAETGQGVVPFLLKGLQEDLPRLLPHVLGLQDRKSVV